MESRLKEHVNERIKYGMRVPHTNEDAKGLTQDDYEHFKRMALDERIGEAPTVNIAFVTRVYDPGDDDQFDDFSAAATDDGDGPDFYRDIGNVIVPASNQSHPNETMLVRMTHPNATLPRRGTGSSAGLDLFAVETVTVKPFVITKVNIGVQVALPPGTVGRILPRSGLGSNGVTIYGGVIDADYRGDIVVLVT